MKRMLSGIVLSLVVLSGCSEPASEGSDSGESEQSAPDQPDERTLSEDEYQDVPALIEERWGPCFDDLDAGGIQRDGDTQTFTATVSAGELTWNAGKGNTGDILTVPSSDTEELAGDC